MDLALDVSVVTLNPFDRTRRTRMIESKVGQDLEVSGDRPVGPLR
jgi:hypothetical protein